MFNTIKRFYTLGIYKKEQLATFVASGWITQEQAEEIVGPGEVKAK